ncbi:MAG: WXG100 family type VII secretion target [Candidatus Eremiobacterota bacterium]
MAQIVVNPDELRRFAAVLETQARETRARQSALQQSLSGLRGSWRDEKFVRFEKLLTETLEQLGRFLKDSDTMVVFLRRKAALADQYLKHS